MNCRFCKDGSCRICYLRKTRDDYAKLFNEAGEFIKDRVSDAKEVVHSVANNNYADSNTQKERLKICGECEHINSLWFCGKCGCNMLVKVKIPGVKCPINKWLALPVIEEEKGGGCAGCGKT